MLSTRDGGTLEGVGVPGSGFTLATLTPIGRMTSASLLRGGTHASSFRPRDAHGRVRGRMFAPLRYLDWAKRLYGRVTWDLATSGIATMAAKELFALAPEDVPEPDDMRQVERFRALVASRYGVSENHVCPSFGASGGIFTVYATLIEPGDDVLIENPSYEPLHAVAAGLGARVRKFDRSLSFQLDVDAVLADVRPNTRLVAIANPHNPGGVHLPDEVIGALANGLDARGVMLVIDEVYREFTAPATTAYHAGPNVCVSASLTKRFGLPWARAGWAILPSPLVKRASDVLTHACGMSPPWQAGLGAFALTHVDALTDRARRLMAGKRALVEAFADRHATKLSWVPPSGEMPFAFFRDLRGDDLLGKIEAGIATDGVIVAPGSFFGYPAGMRLSFTAPRESVIGGLTRLERTLDL
jgi:aspartate/methionine/tyrosine aminotransferase